MYVKKLIIAATVLVLVMMLGITSCSPTDIKALNGILKQVDALSGNVTVTMKDGSTVNFNLADIELNADDGGISLEPGDNVTIERGNHGEVKKVKICYGEIQGTIKSIVGDNVTITTVKKGDVAIQVTPQTVIIMAEKNHATLADLAIGQMVTAKYDTSTLKAIKILVHLEKREAEIQGTIKSISGDNVTITTVKNGDIGLIVTSETRIMTITTHNKATIADLAVGQKVTAKYEIATNKAITIIVHLEKKIIKYDEIIGTIKSIVDDNVTITTPKKGDVTVLVTEATKIIVGMSGNATLADLTVGQKVTAKYETDTKIAVNIIVYPEKKIVKYTEIQGTIKSILGANVTISVLKKGDVTVIVTPDTRIVIGESGNATLSDLAMGQSINVKYETSTKIAVNITVKVYKVIKDIQGIVQAVGSDNKTITLGGNDTESIVLNITPETVFNIVGIGTGSISNLEIGEKVKVKYYADTMNAIKIDIYLEEE